jgi:mannose-6-phosphate isomerase-like protein (cupin superfamily)
MGVHDSDSVMLWDPATGGRRAPRIREFADWVEATRGVAVPNYDALWRWSVEDDGPFWEAIWDYFAVGAREEGIPARSADSMPRQRWFEGSTVNFAEYLLAQGSPEEVAVIGVDETGREQRLTRAEVRRQVRALAGHLTDLGVGEGDVVAGYLPNLPEAVVALLATASVGAVWSSVGQDYAWPAVTAIRAHRASHSRGPKRTSPRSIDPLPDKGKSVMALHTIRRVVTGHSPDGTSIVLFDSPAKEVLEFPGWPGAGTTEVWATDESPANVESTEDRARPAQHDPTPNGTLFRVLEIPPSAGLEIDVGAVFESLGSKNRSDEISRSKHVTMHRTDSIDYLVIISGELVMIMGDGTEVLLRSGDCIVQQGTDHAWEIRGTEPCLMATVLIDADRPAVLKNS